VTAAENRAINSLWHRFHYSTNSMVTVVKTAPNSEQYWISGSVHVGWAGWLCLWRWNGLLLTDKDAQYLIVRHKMASPKAVLLGAVHKVRHSILTPSSRAHFVAHLGTLLKYVTYLNF